MVSIARRRLVYYIRGSTIRTKNITAITKRIGGTNGKIYRLHKNYGKEIKKMRKEKGERRKEV